MDWIYLVGLLVVIFSAVSLFLLVFADCDIVTLLYSLLGKHAETEFKGKVVWITGASSGIGEALAKRLAKVGAKLVLTARRKEELERVKRESLEGSQLKANDILVLPLDLTQLETHEPALKRVLSHFNKLDVLISNAGQAHMDEFVKMDMHVDRHIFELNVFSVVNMNRLVVKNFMEQGGGKIVVVSSVGGRISGPLGSAYVASKHAIHGYFNTLRMETYGKNIDLTLICPGPVNTPFFEKGVTNKPGEHTKVKLPKGVNFMPVERCAHLALVSVANGLDESWIAKFPSIPVVYLQIYFPNIAALFFKLTTGIMMRQMMEP